MRKIFNFKTGSSQQPMQPNIWSKKADMWSPKIAAQIRKKKRKTMKFGSVYQVFIGLAHFCGEMDLEFVPNKAAFQILTPNSVFVINNAGQVFGSTNRRVVKKDSVKKMRL